MQKFLKESDIHFRVTRNPDNKTAVIERFNRMLKERIWWLFYIKIRGVTSMFCEDIVRAYNHTHHSSTRKQPVIVMKENARVARENIAR